MGVGAHILRIRTVGRRKLELFGDSNKACWLGRPCVALLQYTSCSAIACVRDMCRGLITCRGLSTC